MNDEQLLRYARHILLDELGYEGQEKLLAAHVLIVGAGGLGAPAAFYLAAAGVGRLTLADDDVVEISNLQRQILHTSARLGQYKAESARQTLHALNPGVQITPITQRLSGAALTQAVEQADMVLDCCDNFATRHAINRACVAASKPLVSGAALRFAGQISTYDLRRSDSPCYHCLFPETDGTASLADEEPTCASTGVLGPLVGIVGSIQAAEAIKLLTHMGEPLSGRLLSVEALTMRWHEVRFLQDPACPVCAKRVSR